ncbi:transketolase family protein [Bacillus sonorensis]|uniref:Transketolase domain-containing protein n=2 Tax=Bacillus sonorensis TaxID=119858 RepID=M5NZL5_9BACI|nr:MULTISPECIES: transketolase C-terminal domain-containing protein [Bacillus]TWK78720.1 1-deoxy-D-xylulose-5-phosphate synthase [Bacillus paralicheniformis]ASB91344.1 Transketolase [Bacillus sonorensis]EME72618.1 transketolase domain-containing protein [Bacillus sonorensis L12]MCY8086679.1 transketolase family protein [Bacillus sonorensis]MCY8404333.1 transketolase family protein [Bacillus sonorensis]
MNHAALKKKPGNNIANRKVISDTLLHLAKENKDILVLTSDSRGSASMAPFADALPDQLVEVGIAEQNLVGIAAGLAASGKKPFVASPACFLSMRSIEQIKVDIAYSRTNVKLIGISGGVSYGALGMSHHSLQDLAVTRAIPDLHVMMPADRHEAKKMTEALVDYHTPVYMRIGRNPVEDSYINEDYDFEIGKAVTMHEGNDLTIIASGETVRIALDTACLLQSEGIGCRVLNMHTIKPLDEMAVIKAAKETARIITIEEHSIYGGLGSAVSEVISQNCPVPVKILGIPDEPAITGNTKEVFEHYGLSVANVSTIAKEMMGN